MLNLCVQFKNIRYGKARKVTVLIELRARFDEQNNIDCQKD
jgi:polyphosphate kinase